MYQPKVSNTQKYEDNQGSHIVTTGKLILIEPEQCEPLKLPGNHRYKKLKPIIISETEPLRFGDWVYNSKSKEIYQITEKPFVEYEHKILALPEHFSDKHLQAIVDGKVEDGDEVLVKCGFTDFIIGKLLDAGETFDDMFKKELSAGNIPELVDDYIIHLNQQNYITLFLIKQSLEEVAKSFMTETMHYDYIEGFRDGVEWFKENNY